MFADTLTVRADCVFAGATVWLLLTDPVTVAESMESGEVTPLVQSLAGSIYDVLVKPAIRPLRATPPEQRKAKKDGSLYAGQINSEILTAMEASITKTMSVADAVYLTGAPSRSTARTVWASLAPKATVAT